MEDLKAIKIVLVEDDAGDQKLIKQSLSKQKISNEVHVANDAEEALEYLAIAKGDNEKNPMPDLILLDLNMPGIGGKEFLKRIKADPELDTIPGIGPTRKKALLKTLGSLTAVKKASRNKLAAVQGIGPELADQLWDFFHS